MVNAVFYGVTILVSILLFECNVFAADKLDSGDTAWILTSTCLVLFMTIPGLALFYGGLVRSKNILSVLMQCFAIACLITVLWIVYGYSLAFSGGGDFIGNLDKAFLSGVTRDSLSGTLPETVFVMFQLTFAIITPALIVGAFAERMKFSAMLLFSAIWFTIVYAPVCHWVWNENGWLFKMGALDFAGGTVVHINSGISALVAALVIGNRRGFPDQQMMPHNLTMTVTGASMLWVGWFGFNAGSAVSAGTDAGMAMLVTHISAAAAALAWMACEWMKYGKASVLGIVTGAVAGLVCITPASGSVGPMGGLALGIAAGFICYYATHIMKEVLKIDDSLDVFTVHGVGGIVGALLVGVFVASNLGGAGFGKDVTMGGQLYIQLISVVATLIYAGVLSFIILKVVDGVCGLRVSEDEEDEGLDTTMHNERGYDI
ncbi:MAG: ammonia channel protein [Nitrospinae bacterium]|nr:ammonia channel protein [Nitrospinota bacterium]